MEWAAAGPAVSVLPNTNAAINVAAFALVLICPIS
jgi:hypothetical protein